MTGTSMRTLCGMGVSYGIAIGRAVCLRTRMGEIYRIPLPSGEVEKEVGRFQAAVEHTHREIDRLRGRVDESLSSDLRGIFDAHLLLVGDSTLAGRIVERIRSEGVNAEWAVHKTVEELGQRFAAMEDSYLRERREDLLDVSHHLIRSLQGISHHELSEVKGDVVVVADDLTPSDAVRLGRERVVGFAIETGGKTSHTTIIARSLNLPAVVGLAGLTEQVMDEDDLILDGESGCIILHPTPEVLEEYRRRKQELESREAALLATRTLPAMTRDGVEIELMANIDLAEEISGVVQYGACGIGLYRSEFLYIERSPELPEEEEHLAIYRQLAEAAAPFPAVIRTYDLGGRKLAREVMATHEENPVLGLRGIRLTLARPAVFRTQLRALFRAGLFGDVWVMVPMVSTLEEVHRFRSFAGEVMDELEREGVPFRRDFKIGVMIEVPSAALIADHLAREVDFFSIGTNDLIQYAMAVDRNNEHVADLYQPLHPGILRMLQFVVDSANQAGISVSVCGEMAADSRFAPVLVALGLRRLSMSPRLIPDIKTLIRDLSVTDLREVLARCLKLATAAEVEQVLASSLWTVSSS